MTDTAFSSIDCVAQCLLDNERTSIFRKAIIDKVTGIQSCLDVGTGSGIMAMMAALAGARKVTAIEYDPYVAECARRNIALNNMGNQITIIEADARVYPYNTSTAYDMVIMEMLTVGMIDEHQVQAFNNLHERLLLTPNAVIIPERQDTMITPVSADFSYHGCKIIMPLHLWKDFSHPAMSPLCPPLPLNSITFNDYNPLEFSTVLPFTPERDAVVNAVLLSSRTHLTGDIIVGGTLTLNGPVLFPIENRKVFEGAPLSMKVSYRFGEGFESFDVDIA